MTIVLFGLLLTALWMVCYGYPNGGPAKTCVEGGFAHHDGADAQTDMAPFYIRVNQSEYSPGDVIQVELEAEIGIMFKGFQVHAQRLKGNTEEHIGEFFDLPNNTRGLSWYHNVTTINCVTHSDNKDKASVILYWRAPLESQGDVVFRSAFVMNYEMFWVNVFSDTVTASLPDQSPPGVIKAKPSEDLSVSLEDTCGKTKGCFLFPGGCTGSDCDQAVAYEYMADQNAVLFDVIAETPGYVAVGWSHDEKMGDDATIHCIAKDDMIAFQVGYSPAMYNNRHKTMGVSDIQIQNVDGKIHCRFLRDVNTTIHYFDDHGHPPKDEKKMFSMTDASYLQVAWGDMHPGTDVAKKHADPPVISTDKINFLEFKTVSGRALPLMISVHATFGILAWLTFAGSAMMLARHFRKELKKPLLGTGAWFQMHRAFACMVFLCSAVAIILIFIFKKEWVQTATLHAIFGLVATGLSLLQIIGGLCRPGLDSSRRQIFNWLHRLGGVIAFGLAAATAIIGANMSVIPQDLKDKETIIIAVWLGVQIFLALVLEAIACQQRCDRANTDAPSENKMEMENEDIDSGSSCERFKIFCLAIFFCGQAAFTVAAVYFLYQ